MDILRNCYSTKSSSSEDEETNDPHSSFTETASSEAAENCDGHNIAYGHEKLENKSQGDGANQQDFFSLNDADDSSADEGDATQSSLGKSEHVATNEATSSDDVFWHPKGSELTYWDEPRKIWKTPADELPVIKSVKACKHKRSHKNKSNSSLKRLKREESNTNNSPAKALSHSPFFIHHKVAPYLHQTVSNKSARSLIAKGTEHCGRVNAVEWCTQPEYSHLLLSASHDKTIKLWNVFSKDGISCLQTIAAHEKGVRSIQWISGTRNILSASFDKTARIFDVERGNKLSEVKPVICDHTLFLQMMSRMIGDNKILICSGGSISTTVYAHESL